MKGPYERLKYDLRRVWECPQCRHRERTAGTATSCFCRCQEKSEPSRLIAMLLISDGAKRSPHAPPALSVAPSAPDVTS